ncbi:UTRA domain-containing protein [Hyphomonas atlantica]|uniref:HTH gntR-type domain-containing protein n=1 Tax=Hyphomonas atlantica TaxID=1280948 RepID=A0A059E2Q9_9PROT|nr:UTRA domain-containing protein [Hyphomonas atlantica]KCZ62244.1 hypothetical protein HY36_15860 [Hyphomonas atlantica]
MTDEKQKSWQSVKEEALARIHSRRWKPGQLIPFEADLAEEFGCSRSTVNRALRALADEGLLDRRRKAGTRVPLYPARKATLSVPVIREDIIAKGYDYSYSLVSLEAEVPPTDVAVRLGWTAARQGLHIVGLHFANTSPYVIEDRWIDQNLADSSDVEAFSNLSPNEWLVTHVPFTAGTIAFSSLNADTQTARLLDCPSGAALFVIERTTRNNRRSITTVRLIFAPGYQIETSI